MLDKAIPTSAPADTTTDLSHLAFCALVALALERQSGGASTPYAETLFLIRWLATAQKQKRFPRSVAIDIQWLLERGRRHGATAKLRQHLEYLWRSCNGNLADQSPLFRLTYACETLKAQGWENFVMSRQEWERRLIPAPTGGNGFYVEKTALNAAYGKDGTHLHPVDFCVVGDVHTFIGQLADHLISATVTDIGPTGQRVTLWPPHSPAVSP